MKKALMVIGLAMCTTLAFAQTTNRFVKPDHKVSVNSAAPSVDYKASIFTKDGDADTIRTFTFAADDMEGITYGADGTITAAHNNTTVDGATVAFMHTQQGAGTYWNRIPDSAYIGSDAYNETYSNYNLWGLGYLRNYFGGRYSQGGDNGFMYMNMLQGELGGGNIHASFTLPAVSLEGHNPAILDVTMLQVYCKFNNDQCFIDYQVNGAWKSWEVNVRGVDVAVNDFASLRPVFTMPVELAQQPSVVLRVRWACNNSAGGAYGYLWAIDDLRIIGGEADRWKLYEEQYVDGAYGTMPQGMKIPLGWFANVANNGTNTRANVHSVISHIGADGTATEVANNTEANIASGNPTEQHQLTIDERGFLDGSPYWFGHNANGEIINYGTDNVPANYKYLPVDNTGLHHVAASATSTGATTLEWDTIPYRVVNRTGSTEDYSYGYRWAHDNGLIPGGSKWAHGYTFNQSDQQYYLTDTGGYNEAGYTVAVRYTTGSEIPTSNGEPWVFLGIEIVPSTDDDNDGYGMDGTGIQPVFMTHVFYSEDTNDYVSLRDIETGFSQQTNYEVSYENDANMDISRILPGEEYNSVFIPFPSQPELEPNRSYFLGYQNATSGFFCPASTSYRYLDRENDNTYVNYLNDEQTAPYYNQFRAYGMDFYVYDAAFQQSTLWYAFNETSFPMIRAVVGPRLPRPTYTVTPICPSSDTNFYILNGNQNEVCNSEQTVYEGASVSFYVLPELTHGDIDTLIIDDIKYAAADFENISFQNGIYVDQNNYNYTPDTEDGAPEIAIYRDYYVVNFENVTGNHSISAIAHYEPWHIGIDPVANECVLGVQPNPATSQVRVSISGVTGMVNCSIIDMSGRVVYNSDFNAEMGQSIDLNSFARGAYFVRVTNGTFSKIEKLIVR